MNTMLAQLRQWPPTASTVHGAAALIALVFYFVTGSWEAAGMLGGALAVICPQDAPAIQQGIADARTIATAPEPKP